MRITLGALLLCLLPVVSQADWKLDRFMISVWGQPTDEASARLYADAGFNTVMAKVENLDLLRPYDIRAIVLDGTPELAAKMQDDPVVWGWYVKDEPAEDAFAATGEAVAGFHAADPKHPAYVNLMAWMNLDRYYELVKPRFLSYDYYQWWWGEHNYCWRLEAHREAALKQDQDLICWIEANADERWEWGKAGATTLPDNAPKLRQSVYLALAYGVRGIQWFNASLVFIPPWEASRELSQSGRQIQTLNRELAALGPMLLRMQSRAVFHTAPVPKNTQALPEDLWVQARNRNLTLGLFEGPGGQRHLMVVNRAINRSQPANLWFPGGLRRVQRFVIARREWTDLEPLPGANGAAAVRLVLEPGDGALLRVE